MLVTSIKWTDEMKARALRNVAWVEANLPSIIAMGVPTPETFADKLRRAAAKKKKENNPDDLERLKEKARRAGQNVDWEKNPKAPKRPRGGASTAAQTTDEDFLARMRAAIKVHAAKSPFTRKAHEQNAERERARYRKPARRERTKGE
jgi:hypothetical protein